MAEDKDEEILALKARLDSMEAARPQPVPPRAKSGCLPWVIGAVVVVLGLYVIGSIGGAVNEVQTASPPADWTPPEGFTPYRTTGGQWMAVDWDKSTRAECRGSGGTCFALNVIVKDACPRSLYAEIKLLGDAGDNLGWTNDTAQGVDAGERVRLVFRTYERGAKSAEVTEINCH